VIDSYAMIWDLVMGRGSWVMRVRVQQMMGLGHVGHSHKVRPIVGSVGDRTWDPKNHR